MYYHYYYYYYCCYSVMTCIFLQLALRDSVLVSDAVKSQKFSLFRHILYSAVYNHSHVSLPGTLMDLCLINLDEMLKYNVLSSN